MSPSSAGMVPLEISRDRMAKDDVLDALVAHPGQASTHSHSPGASMLLWMLVDGVGLAIITACTILEGFELWTNYFNEYWDFNVPSLTFWFSGRFCQVVGLISLIIHAASMQVFHELEWAGMMMLTAGPILNLCACSIFDSGVDTSYMFNKQWMTSESLELLGIVILDLSMIEGPEHLVLSAEVIGFMTLACAAILDFEYTLGQSMPVTTVRVDLIHVSDCFGLGLLTVVAIGQYHIKLAKHKIVHGSNINSNYSHKVHKSHSLGNIQKRGQGLSGNDSGHYGDNGVSDVELLEDGLSEMSNLIPVVNGVSSHHVNLNQNQSSSLHRNLSSPYNIGKGLAHSSLTSVKSATKLSTTYGEKRLIGSSVSLLSQDEQHND